MMIIIIALVMKEAISLSPLQSLPSSSSQALLVCVSDCHSGIKSDTRKRQWKSKQLCSLFLKLCACALLFLERVNSAYFHFLLLVLFRLHFIILAIRAAVTSMPIYVYVHESVLSLGLPSFFSVCLTLQQSKRDTTTFSRKIRRKDGRIDYYYAKTFAWLFEQKKWRKSCCCSSIAAWSSYIFYYVYTCSPYSIQYALNRIKSS